MCVGPWLPEPVDTGLAGTHNHGTVGASGQRKVNYDDRKTNVGFGMSHGRHADSSGA